MSSTTPLDDAAARTPAPQPRVRVARKHHLPVRVSHWLNVLLLTGLIVSGISSIAASEIRLILFMISSDLVFEITATT